MIFDLRRRGGCPPPADHFFESGGGAAERGWQRSEQRGGQRRNDCNIPLVIAPVGRTVETRHSRDPQICFSPPGFPLYVASALSNVIRGPHRLPPPPRACAPRVFLPRFFPLIVSFSELRAVLDPIHRPSKSILVILNGTRENACQGGWLIRGEKVFGEIYFLFFFSFFGLRFSYYIRTLIC